MTPRGAHVTGTQSPGDQDFLGAFTGIVMVELTGDSHWPSECGCGARRRAPRLRLLCPRMRTLIATLIYFPVAVRLTPRKRPPCPIQSQLNSRLQLCNGLLQSTRQVSIAGPVVDACHSSVGSTTRRDRSFRYLNAKFHYPFLGNNPQQME